MSPPLAQRQQETRALLRAAGVLPVVTVEDLPQAIALAGALARGGLTAIEVTLRSPAAMAALGVLKRELPQLCIGAGTVRSASQARQAVDQGVDFLVTPGTPPALAQALAALGLPVVPGAATASEMMALMDLGFDALKLFPAVAIGGLALVKSLAGPLPDLALCPTGGINEANAADFLRQPNVLCVGGSWMVAAEWVAAGQFDRVEESARRARALLEGLAAERRAATAPPRAAG
jgi:2-dehydro-3-deoxyphosphogluconate aldolase/(4S)-4-hydroxy-2-oxoglutarate aldolase